jgi:hypothetical protein
MGLEDFEKELAQSKAKESRKKRDRSRSRDRSHRHRSDRHHKRSRHERETSEERTRRKRRERERDRDGGDRSRRKHKDERSRSPSDDEEDRLTSKRKSRHDLVEEDSASDGEPMDKDYGPPEDDILDQQLEAAADAHLQRDSWMQAPSSMDVDYVQRKKKEEKTQWVGASAEKQHALKVHNAELNHHLKDLEEEDPMVEEEPVQRDVSYTFGDSGSHWRMTKLKGVYRIAEEEGRTVEDVALQKYGHLRDFDEAREEEIEVDRMNMYGKNYVGKEKPSGELYAERRLKAGVHRPPRRPSHTAEDLPQGEVIPDSISMSNTVKLSQTELNKLKGQLMKAKMKKASNVAELEAQYNAAMAGGVAGGASNVVTLNAMDNRMLAGGRQGEVKELTNKRGLERGLVVENEDMSIEDMVRQERRTKNQAGGEGMLLAEKIAKDSKFDVSGPYPCLLRALLTYVERPRLSRRECLETSHPCPEIDRQSPQYRHLRLPPYKSYPRLVSPLPPRRQVTPTTTHRSHPIPSHPRLSHAPNRTRNQHWRRCHSAHPTPNEPPGM